MAKVIRKYNDVGNLRCEYYQVGNKSYGVFKEDYYNYGDIILIKNYTASKRNGLEFLYDCNTGNILFMRKYVNNKEIEN